MNYVKNNLLSIIILILFLVSILQRCEKSANTPISTRDTITTISYVYIKDTIKSKPIFIKGERDTILENTIEYIPSEDYAELKEQFQELKQQLFSKNIFKDQIKIDTFGTIDITDTLQKNTIVGRRYVNNIKIPEKTITITNTIYPPSKNKWFTGGGIGGNQYTLINDFNAGLSLLNKKDQLYQVKARVDLKGNIFYEVSSFWKIKRNK